MSETPKAEYKYIQKQTFITNAKIVKKKKGYLFSILAMVSTSLLWLVLAFTGTLIINGLINNPTNTIGIAAILSIFGCLAHDRSSMLIAASFLVLCCIFDFSAIIFAAVPLVFLILAYAFMRTTYEVETTTVTLPLQIAYSEPLNTKEAS